MSPTIQKLKKEYDELTAINDHTGAAQLLVKQFGTRDDNFNMNFITAAHNRQGYLTVLQLESRDQIVKKWWSFYRMLTNEKPYHNHNQLD